MTQPQQVGSAYISITPKLDSSGMAAFRAQLKREMKSLDFTTVARMRADVDTTGAQRKVKEFRKTVDRSIGKQSKKKVETALYQFTSFRNLAQLGLLVSGVMAGTKVAVAAVAPALVALGSSAAFASISLTALGPALVGVSTAAWGMSQAFFNVTEALDLNKKAAKGSKAAAEDLETTLGEMSEEGTTLYRTILKLQEANQGFRRDMEKATLPGFTKFLEDIQEKSKGSASTLDLLKKSAMGFGGTIGKTVSKLGDFFKSDAFKADFKFMDSNNQAAFGKLGSAINKVIPPLFRLFSMSSPLVLRFSSYIDKLAGKFDSWISSFTDADISVFFSRAGDEMAKWWRLASNIGQILLSVMGAAAPSGGGLVDRLIGFTDAIKGFTKSERGQAQIAKFFNYFRDFDYAKMVNTIGQAAMLAGIFKGVALVASHPILMFMAALAVQYPSETAAIINSVSQSLQGVMSFAAKNPEAITALLALIAAYKGLAILRGLKLPAIPSAGAGGGAAVVGGGAGGKGAGGRFAGGGANVLAAVGTLVVGDILLNDGASFKKFFKDFKGGIKSDFNSKDPEKMLPGEFQMFDAVGKSLRRFFSHTLPESIVTEGKTGWKGFFREIREDLGMSPKTGAVERAPGSPALSKGGTSPAINLGLARAAEMAQRGLNAAIAEGTLNLTKNSEQSANLNTGLQNYILTNNKSMLATYEHLKATKGEAEAQKWLAAQNGTSQRALVKTLVQLGWNQKAAESYAAKVKAVPRVAPTDVELKKDEEAKTRLRTLRARIDEVAKQHTITVDVDDKKDVEDRLRRLGIHQHALAKGISLSRAAAEYKKLEGNHFATGGWTGPGSKFQPAGVVHADEFVIQKSSRNKIEKAAPGLLNHLNRTGNLPMDAMYATGGRVWPYPVDISNTKIPKPPQDAFTGGGGSGGPQGWRNMMGWLRSKMGNKVQLSSGMRPGDPGYHGKGRAVDLNFSDGSQNRGGGLALKAFNLIKGNFKKSIKELIWDFAKGKAVWNGEDHFFTGPGAGPGTHNDHIHWAHDNGGPLLPNVGTNHSGKPELVLNNAQAHAFEDRIRGGGDSVGDVIVYIDGEPFRGIARAEIKKSDGDFVNTLTRGRGRGN